MVDAVKSFAASTHNGVFINSCFAHCQSERQDTWYASDSPTLHGKVNIFATFSKYSFDFVASYCKFVCFLHFCADCC